MNASGFWHLAWKDYRAVRAFWVAMIVLVLLAQALILAVAYPPRAGPHTTLWRHALAPGETRSYVPGRMPSVLPMSVSDTAPRNK